MYFFNCSHPKNTHTYYLHDWCLHCHYITLITVASYAHAQYYTQRCLPVCTLVRMRKPYSASKVRICNCCSLLIDQHVVRCVCNRWQLSQQSLQLLKSFRIAGVFIVGVTFITLIAYVAALQLSFIANLMQFCAALCHVRLYCAVLSASMCWI